MKLMTRNGWIFIVLCSLTAPSFAAPPERKTSLEDVRRETKDLLETLKVYTAAQRAEAIKQINATLEHLDKRIDLLEADIDKNWEKMDQSAREKARATVKNLHKERTQVAEWYGSLKSSSVDAWEKTKTIFTDAYSDLNATWEGAEKEFGSEK